MTGFQLFMLLGAVIMAAAVCAQCWGDASIRKPKRPKSSTAERLFSTALVADGSWRHVAECRYFEKTVGREKVLVWSDDVVMLDSVEVGKVRGAYVRLVDDKVEAAIHNEISKPVK